MNPRQADAVAELTHNFLLLIIRADNRFAQNAEIIREFRFALVLVGIFRRHSDSDSQLGANQRRTKVNLGLDMNAPGMWFMRMANWLEMGRPSSKLFLTR